MLYSKASFLPPLLDVIYSMVMKWRSVAERSRWSKWVCSQDLNSESDCFPPLPLFYMDSETMGVRNVRCLSLIGCYRLRVHWGSHWLEKFGAKFWRDFLAPFFKQTLRDRNLHSSFVISFWYSQSKHWIYLAVDINNFNKVLWWILLKIL